MRAWIVALALGLGATAAADPLDAAGADAANTDAMRAGPADATPADAISADAPRADASPADASPADASPADASAAAASPLATPMAPTAPSVAPTAALSPVNPLAPLVPVAAPETTKSKTLFAIKVIGGLVALLVLAYLGGNRRVVRFQERLGISGVITAGFPFIALGLIASRPSVGILNGDVLGQLQPILHFGLGWLGFIIGAQLDIRVLDRVPKGTAYLILVEALGPFALTAIGCGAVMVAFGLSVDDPALWRDTILLGTAAAMTAPRKFRGFANRTWHEGRGVDVLLGQLDELVSIVGLLFITAYFRESTSTTWQVPDTAWVFVSLGLGLAVGALIFAMLRVPASDPEFLAIVLGGIAFASGLAGYLHLSPIVVCFLAGTLVTNFPNDQRDSVFRILHHLERPVHLLFLIIVGAVWGNGNDVADWRGWVLVPLFVAGRAIGKWTGVIASKTAVGGLLPTGFADDRALFTPMSGLSIALVISIDSFRDRGLPWIITAVVGGSLATEFLIRKNPGETAPQLMEELEPSAPLDELDDLDDLDEPGAGADDGPVYRDEAMPPTKPEGAE